MEHDFGAQTRRLRFCGGRSVRAPSDMDASFLLTHRAQLSPDSEAIVDCSTGHRYTFAQVNEWANRTAHWLHAMGVEYGDRVSILGHNSVAYVDLLFACGKIGAVFTPLNWRLTARELAYIVNDCAPEVLIVEPEFADLLDEMRGDIAVPQIVTRAEFEAAAREMATHEPARPSRLNGESIHAILYTSGTTGRPKGALIPHRQLLWNAISTVVSWELSSADCAPILTPMFHAGGLFVFLTTLVYAGGKSVIARTFDSADSLRLIAQERCTVVLGVPTIYQMWLESKEVAKHDLSSVRFFLSGGAPCPVPLIHRWRETTGIALRQGYGMSEVGVNCFAMSDAESISKAGSVGKPIFHLAARIVDQDGRDVEDGATGELVFQGMQVCAGYLNNHKATAQTIRDGWFYTGDMARRDEDGFFAIIGRFKDMLISGGENVYAAEVESVFMAHPAVQECALIGKADEKWGEVGVLFVVLAKDADASRTTLLTHSREHLARYKVPKEIVFLDELPHSPYGKVEKIKLKEQFLSFDGNAKR